MATKLANAQEIIATIDDFRTLARKTKGELLPSTYGFDAQNIRFTEEYGSIEKRKSRSLYGGMSTLGTSRVIFIDRFYRSAIELYTKLLMHFDGANGAITFSDETGKAITNPVTELDYMEYSSDALAQAAYVSDSGYYTGVDQSLATGYNTLAHIIGDAVGQNFSSPNKLAQGFQVSAGGITCYGASLFLSKALIPSGTYTVSIQTNSGGAPSGSLVDGNATLTKNVADITDGDWQEWVFPATFALSAATLYWLVIERSVPDSTNYFNAYTLASGTGTYPNGNAKYYYDGSWHDGDANPCDIYFKINKNTIHYLDVFSEPTIKTQGTYSLKIFAKQTDTLNKTLTRTISSPIDLTGVNQLRFDIWASRTGANIKIGIHDSGGTTTEKTYTVVSADTWETATWDISAIADADKDVIDKIVITVLNADADNTLYIDNFTTQGVTINTTTKKFGTASALFIKGSYLSALDTNDWYSFDGNFTIDDWVNFTSLTDAQVICGQYQNSNNYWYIKKDTNANGNKLSLEFKSGGTVKGSYVMTSAWSGVSTGTQYHLEFARNGTSALIFINGTSQTLTETTAFSTNDVGKVTGNLIIGQQNKTNYFQGYMDELRISKGICRHTANFTAPTSAYDDTVNSKYLLAAYGATLQISEDVAGSFSTLQSGFTANLRRKALTYKAHWYSCNGQDNNIVCDGLNVETMGVPIPTVPTLALVGSGALTGTYQYKVTYEIDGYQEGSASDASAPAFPSGENITVTIPVSTNTRVTARNIYRTTNGGSIYYFLTRVANNIETTYLDSNLDTVLDTAIPVPIDNDSPPIFKYLCLHKSRIFGLRVVGNLSRAVYSHISNGMSLPDVFPVDNYFDVIKDNGEDGTAILEDNFGQLVVFKPSAVVKIDTSTDDPVGWSGFSNILSINGCIAPYTAVKTPMGIIYLTRYAEGKKCLMLWNGSGTSAIFTELEPILSAISEDRVLDMIAQYHNGAYHLSYSDPTDGNSYNDRVLIIDLTTGAWVIDKKNVDCFSSWTSGIVGVIGADSGELYTSSSDTTGLIHHEDTSTVPLTESSIAMYYLSQWIDFGWLSAIFKRIRKQLFQVRVDFERAEASGNLYFGYYLDNSSSLTQKAYSFVTYASKGFFIYQFPIGTYCKNLRFRLYHDDDISTLKIKAVHFVLSPEPLSEIF